MTVRLVWLFLPTRLFVRRSAAACHTWPLQKEKNNINARCVEASLFGWGELFELYLRNLAMFACFLCQGASNDQIYSSPQEAKGPIHLVINNMAVGMNRSRVFPTLHEPAINPSTNAIGVEFNAARFIPRFRFSVQRDMFYCLGWGTACF